MSRVELFCLGFRPLVSHLRVVRLECLKSSLSSAIGEKGNTNDGARRSRCDTAFAEAISRLTIAYYVWYKPRAERILSHTVVSSQACAAYNIGKRTSSTKSAVSQNLSCRARHTLRGL